jgi:hypothetical protein
MSSGSENNALVEIALALSMAFFSLMVVTMVSMGVGKQNKKMVRVTADTVGLSLKNAVPASKGGAAGSKSQIIKPEKLAIYYQGKFYDAGLNPLVAHNFQSKQIKFLAVAPDLSMSKAISVRDQFGDAGLIVTTLSAVWLKSLKEKIK